MARTASEWVSVRGSPARLANSLHAPGMRSRCSAAPKGRVSSARAIAASAHVLARAPRARKRRALRFAPCDAPRRRRTSMTGWCKSFPHSRTFCITSQRTSERCLVGILALVRFYFLNLIVRKTLRHEQVQTAGKVIQECTTGTPHDSVHIIADRCRDSEIS